MTYVEKLKHPKWQRKRLFILWRDNFKCRICGTTHHLNVHHMIYEKGKEIWESNMNDLITLCNYCHRKIHQKLYRISKIYHSKKRDRINYLEPLFDD